MPRSLAGLLGRDRRGATAATFALLVPALVGSISFGVDSARIQYERNKLQIAADAAATAGARQLKTPTLIASAAIGMAEANVPSASSGEDEAPGSVLKTSDVVWGSWDGTTRTFTPKNDVAASNAVRVTTRFAAANNNKLNLIFGSILGLDAPDLSAAATAVAKTSCTENIAVSVLGPGLPTRTGVVTQGEPCLPGSGWTGNCFWAKQVDIAGKETWGSPIIRVDSAYAGEATVGFELISPVSKKFTFIAPAQGKYWVVLTGFDMPNTGSTTLVFSRVTSVPRPASVQGGTASYANKFNVRQTLPGTPLCVPGTYRYQASRVD